MDIVLNNLYDNYITSMHLLVAVSCSGNEFGYIGHIYNQEIEMCMYVKSLAYSV